MPGETIHPRTRRERFRLLPRDAALGRHGAGVVLASAVHGCRVAYFSGIKHAYMMPDACAAVSKTMREFSMARALAILNNLRSSSEKLRKAQ